MRTTAGLSTLAVLLMACSGNEALLMDEQAAAANIDYRGIALDVCTEALPTTPIDFSNMEVELVANGFKGAEGPVWVASENSLYFSEINRDPSEEEMLTNADSALANIIKLDVQTKASEIWVAASGTNGLALSMDGLSLLGAVNFGPVAQVARIDLASKTVATITDSLADGSTFNAPNDLVVRSDGSIYFTDPTWGSTKEGVNGGMPEPGSTPFYRIDVNGNPTVGASENLVQPNGIALSPDETKLYVSSVVGNPRDFGWRSPGVIMSYDVAEDGSVSNPAIFESSHSSDGMVVDCAGNVYSTERGFVFVNDRDGKRIGAIRVLHSAYQASNVVFGGKDHKTLFVTVEQKNALNDETPKEHGIYKVELPIQGLPQ